MLILIKKYFERLEQEVNSEDEGEKVKFNMMATYSDLLEKSGLITCRGDFSRLINFRCFGD